MRLGVGAAPGARSAARSRSRSRAAGRSTRRGAGGTRRRRPATRSGACRTAGTGEVSFAGPSSARAEDDERRVAQEHEPAARPQEPRRLGDPAVRVDPDRRAVLREHEVGARVRQPGLGGVGLDERELDPGLGHQPPRGVELRGRDVDADRPRAELREPRREVRGAAAELDDVEARDVAEDVQLGLVDRPDAPGDLVERPVVRRVLVGVLRVRLRPELRVPRGVARAWSGEPIGEPDPDLALGRLGRVGAVDEVVRHRERERRRAASRDRRRRDSSRRSSCGRSRSRPRPRARTRASAPR